MILYRISREKYVDDLSGIGGALSSARWHDHLPIIYTSLNSSTSILEKFVHLNPDEIHHDLVIATIEADDSLTAQTINPKDLPINWRDYPAPDQLKRVGNAWLRSKSSALLFVPSVLDPLANNVLINPMYPNIQGKIKVFDYVPFKFDVRLAQKR